MAHDQRVLETLLARVALTAAGPLPPAMLQPALDLVVRVLERRHGGAFERLRELDDADILVDPIDLPLAFRLELGRSGVALRLVRRDGAAETSATIRGTFAHLLDLLEGRIDGDALFFSRDLTIAGDTAVVVALRNAVDGEDIDLAADVAALLGPFGRLLPPAREAAARAVRGLSGLHEALLEPALRRVDGVERRVNRLEGRR